jgi:hypothetical protein
VVTSRAADDNLFDDQDTRTSDIMAPPRQPSRKPTPAKTDTANSDPARTAPARTASPDDAISDGRAGGGVSPNGTPAGGKEDAPASGAAASGVPALPADTIGSSPAAQPKAKSGADREKLSADDSPALSFGPPSASVQPAEDPAGTTTSGSGAAPASGLASPAGSASLASSRPAQADPPSVSPAAFAWEMPDPPAHSPSSPARTFLRSGTSGKNPPAPRAAPSSGGTDKAVAESPAASRGAKPKATAKQPKRTARQAHLTVARVEPWSVMKFSFVVSLVAFVILFVAVTVLYGVLAGLGVFDSLQRVVSDVTSSQGSAGVNAKAWFSASRVLGYTALLGSLNIVLITAMSTIGAVVYNLTSRMVGGVEVTLKETE